MSKPPEEEFATGIVLVPQEPPKWLLEAMDEYNRTGLISARLLEASAPYLDESAEAPEAIEAFPGHLK